MRKINLKTVEQHAEPGNHKCLVNLFKTYINLIPQDGPFYKRPVIKLRNTIPQFSNQNVGEKTLKVYFKRMFQLAKIDTTGRNISNHSGKVTLCTELFNQGFDDKIIKGRSGHRSDSVNAYKRPRQNLLEAASKALQPSSSKY